MALELDSEADLERPEISDLKDGEEDAWSDKAIGASSEWDLSESPYVQGLFAVLYSFVCLLGVTGNMMVITTVFCKKHMHTVTNFLIANLAMSDILTDCMTVPFTPAIMLMDDWIFGQFLCRVFGMASAVSIYVSTLTSTVIAIDRYFVITHPLLPRMTIQIVGAVIVATWAVAFLISLPIGIYQQVTPRNQSANGSHQYCLEGWPDPSNKTVFDLISAVLQFVVPCVVIGWCYANVWIALRKRNAKRAKRTASTRGSEREELEMRRNRRMTILFVSIISYFIVTWLPLNMYHVANRSSVFWFLTWHLVAMSGTVVNPLLYAFLNENFRKEFVRLCWCVAGRFGRRESHHSHGATRELSRLLPSASGAGSSPKSSSKRVTTVTSAGISTVTMDNAYGNDCANANANAAYLKNTSIAHMNGDAADGQSNDQGPPSCDTSLPATLADGNEEHFRNQSDYL